MSQISHDEPSRAKTCLRAYADSEGPDQPAHPSSQIRSEQSDQGPRCPLTEALDITESMNNEQRPGWYLAHAQDDLHPFILRMLKGTFSLGVAHMINSSICSNLVFVF